MADKTTAMTDIDILAALNEQFTGEDNYGRPKAVYCKKIMDMSSDELFKEAKGKIWLSAFANNNPRSDYHWHVDAIYALYRLRNDLDSYRQAFRQVYIAEFGRDPYPNPEDI